MDVEKLKEELHVGIIEPEYIDYLKNLYIQEIFRKKDDPVASTALVAYSSYLNEEGINSDNYPLYLTILATNNKYAVDALLEGYDHETYLDCVQPNHFIIKNYIKFLEQSRKNEVYRSILEVIFGFLSQVYNSPEEGYQLYQPTIADVNSIGKYLDEDKDQEDELNRIVLDVLLYISKLDTVHETDSEKKNMARHAARIRSDFFDTSRSLINSMTDVILETVENPDYGIPPEYVYSE